MRSLRFPVYLVMVLFVAAGFGPAQAGSTHALTQVYSNNDFQITGVTVFKTGRVFVNFPRWSDHYLNAVVEIGKDGSAKPFPDETWNRWDMKPENAGKQFVCVQSVVVDDSDSMWVVDAAAPMMGSVVPGGPKLVKIDLKSNQVSKVFAMGPDVAKTNSYLNDIRIDTKNNVAYLTDSGAGGLVVVDTNSGKGRRVLEGHASTMAEQGVQIVINGKPVQANGKPPQINADSITLSPDGQYLYYKPLTGVTLYRVKTEVLRNASASAEQVSAAVENLGKVFPTDGFWMDQKGNLYLSNIENNAVTRRSPDGKMEKLVSDPRLAWPDTFSEGPDGSIYITASHIHETPRFNQGRDVRKTPYAVFKFKP